MNFPVEKMSTEGLAASQLLDKNDPTLLSWKEIKDSWGTCLNFFYSFGLKPWNFEDCDEARAISRSFKAGDDEQAQNEAPADLTRGD